MNVLLVGAGKGSWQMRGEQLGAAIGARVTSDPTPAEWAWATVAILVKNHGARFASTAHSRGIPIVWDAVDCWKQPLDNGADDTRARALLAAQLTVIRPALFIGATQTMADAGGGVYLPHHSWRGLWPVPPRDAVARVAYQGNPAYLGTWRGAIEAACRTRGWTFALASSDGEIGRDLWQADLLVALRDGPWDGPICRQWKSGVKLVNAIAAGRPVITQPSAAFRELQPPGSAIESVADLAAAFDTWTSLEARTRAYECARAQAPAYTLPAIAERYRTILADRSIAWAA
jgi:hypothetical protein